MRVLGNILFFFIVVVALLWFWRHGDARNLMRGIQEGGNGAAKTVVDGAGRALCKAWGC